MQKGQEAALSKERNGLVHNKINFAIHEQNFA